MSGAMHERDVTIKVTGKGREWAVSRDGVLLSAHPSADEALRAVAWLLQHSDGRPGVPS